MCKSCEALMINGVYCHETGCPDSDKDANGEYRSRECPWCGSGFVPEDGDQMFCDEGCAASYNS